MCACVHTCSACRRLDSAARARAHKHSFCFACVINTLARRFIYAAADNDWTPSPVRGAHSTSTAARLSVVCWLRYVCVRARACGIAHARLRGFTLLDRCASYQMSVSAFFRISWESVGCLLLLFVFSSGVGGHEMSACN